MKTLFIACFTFIASAFCGENVIAQGTSSTQPNPLLRLKMLADNTNTDEIVIRLNNSTSSKFVENEDAQDLGGINALVNLSAFSSDNVPLSIDYLPYPG